MTLTFDPNWVISILLCSVRIGALLLLTPLGSNFAMPPQVRAFLVLVLAASLVLSVPGARLGEGGSSVDYATQALKEAAIGGLIGFGVLTSFAAFSLAGKLLDVQIGLGIGSMFDPVSNVSSGPLAMALDLLAVTAFLLLDGHHALLRGLAYSFEQAPLGAAVPAVSSALLAKQFGTVFSVGLLIAAPVAACILFVDVVLAVISRTLAQMNVFLLGIPLKIVVGIAALSVAVQFIGPVIERAFGGGIRFMDWVLR